MPALQLKKPTGSENPTRELKNPIPDHKMQLPAGYVGAQCLRHYDGARRHIGVRIAAAAPPQEAA